MHLFPIFSRMISHIPTPAVLRALDVECRMLEEDVENDRLNLTEDTLSILCFEGFVHMAKCGNVMRCSMHLPTDHAEFYKETVLRLVQAGELPDTAAEEFDYAFLQKN